MMHEMEREREVLERYVSLPVASGSMSGPESRARLHNLMSSLPVQAPKVGPDVSVRYVVGWLVLVAAFAFGLWLNATGKVG